MKKRIAEENNLEIINLVNKRSKFSLAVRYLSQSFKWRSTSRAFQFLLLISLKKLYQKNHETDTILSD